MWWSYPVDDEEGRPIRIDNIQRKWPILPEEVPRHPVGHLGGVERGMAVLVEDGVLVCGLEPRQRLHVLYFLVHQQHRDASETLLVAGTVKRSDSTYGGEWR